MYNIICWKWDNGLHPKKLLRFSHEDVNELYRMLNEKCSESFQLTCITDNSEDINPNIRIIPIWEEHLNVGGCFVRLKVFSSEMKELIGDRFISIDLDCVITADPYPIFTREEDFVIWGEEWRRTPYCGSLFIMDAGCREEVYTEFDIEKYPPNRPGPSWSLGTDQARISDCLYPNELMLSSKEGLYNFRTDIRINRRKPKVIVLPVTKPVVVPTDSYIFQRLTRKEKRLLKKGRTTYTELRKRFSDKKLEAKRSGVKTRVKPHGGNGKLPEDAIIVFFNGKFDPANAELQKEYPWIKEHYKWTRS